MQELTYRQTGVDPEEKSELLRRVLSRIRATFTPYVVGDIGHFGGFVRMPSARDPVLVASIDGVGTKTRVATLTGDHATIGHDVVSHCLNDLAVAGAAPLLFLDYVAASHLLPEVFEALMAGMTDACRRYGAALVGGETAQMPGVYEPGAYDVVGTAVGVVERDRILDGRAIRPDDVLIGLASDGAHTNGYTLARAALLREEGDARTFEPTLGATRGEALMRPHRCYAPALLAALAEFSGALTGAAHITGGGIPGNLFRILPKGCRAHVCASWDVPPLFGLIARAGPVGRDEMFRTFNMGVGLVVVVRPADADTVAEFFAAHGERPFPIGEVRRGVRGVEIFHPYDAG
ncbi:MAG: phosphoribosylformylglycinamidine cyclo-ligase [Armatimonadota bacterium]|nr:phosphoribosylformylglycinamidine cyclo-ligase [Armatimonadota bacterium]MDR5697834.1 phosphoribosylformylglycinamidine cyclo-ligase [Armatimonadota bacterium]